ncbi:hypothetical protein ACS0PU_002671 [Formica fusca]
MASKKVSVSLQNAETNEIYTITVTAEEAKRIKTHLDFATKKLHEAMEMSSETLGILTDAIYLNFHF